MGIYFLQGYGAGVMAVLTGKRGTGVLEGSWLLVSVLV
jgi:hypothetical protein